MVTMERCEKPTPLGVGWIALLIYTLLCIFLFFIHILCYTTTMENKYRHTNTTVSLINYHFVFCPRYRRKIFLIPNVEERFKELVKIKCK